LGSIGYILRVYGLPRANFRGVLILSCDVGLNLRLKIKKVGANHAPKRMTDPRRGSREGSGFNHFASPLDLQIIDACNDYRVNCLASWVGFQERFDARVSIYQFGSHLDSLFGQ